MTFVSLSRTMQPAIVDIEMTNACNQQCGFCLRSSMQRPVGMMDLATFKRIIDELAGFDFPTWGKVVLAGFGEPTLHPRFIEAVAYAGAKGVPLRVYTNGTRLDTEIRQALLHPGIKALKLSINAHGQCMFSRVTATRTSWDDLVRGVTSLLRERITCTAGPEITLQLLYTADLPDPVKVREIPVLDTPEMALTATRFWQTVSLEIAQEAGVSPTPTPVPLKDIRSGLVFDLFEHVRLKLCPYLPYRTHFDPTRRLPSGLNFQNCTRHFNNVVVFWDGACAPCCTDVNCQMYLGNVTHSSLRAVFNSPAAIANRAKWSTGQSPSELCRICLNQGH